MQMAGGLWHGQEKIKIILRGFWSGAHTQRRAGGHICLQLACHGNEVPKASGDLCGSKRRPEWGRQLNRSDSLYHCHMDGLLCATQTDHRRPEFSIRPLFTIHKMNVHYSLITMNTTGLLTFYCIWDLNHLTDTLTEPSPPMLTFRLLLCLVNFF